MYIITGQTATGKTSLALQLAKQHNGELINCDSRQIYKHLNIITGKDIDIKAKFTLKQKLGKFTIGYDPLTPSHIKIWLYNIVDPKIPFSSYDWATCAKIAIKDIVKRGKTPIIVGGTYLYIKHLLYGFETEKIPPNWKLRKLFNQKSVSGLQKELKKIAPDVFNKLNQSDVANPQRLIRKIEIALYNSKQLSVNSRQSTVGSSKFYDLPSDSEGKFENFIGFKYKDKNQLIKAITKRVNLRIKQGALNEVRLLLAKNYLPTDPGLKTIGYSQLIEHFSGKVSLKEVVNTWIIRETQYAKRQFTFMKKDSNIHWHYI